MSEPHPLAHPLGRPPLDPTQPSVSVSVPMPLSQFAAFCARAQAEGVSVPAIIRADLDAAATRDPRAD
jgi:hypothetical protein